ncbi:hypothetical protein [Paraburkholderia rhynchosiae]|uniref:hypothetical protein n=1 Tax=Paraburkholderia rhynchosiae TaxID=487049 RepID=UPI0011AF3C73|nr:hypothetical protein [Paraburkholderia rhynchosiae]
MNLYLIYTRSNLILLSRREYESWQQIQEDIDDYMTSLGPWSAEETVEYLREEHPDLSPDAAEQMRSFLSKGESTVSLRFAHNGGWFGSQSFGAPN